MESNDTRGKNCFKIKILEITANENELNKNSKIGILSWRCGTLRTYHFPDLLHPVSCPRAVPRELSSLWGWRGYGHIWGISWHLCSSPLPPEKLGACCPSSPAVCGRSAAPIVSSDSWTALGWLRWTLWVFVSEVLLNLAPGDTVAPPALHFPSHPVKGS